MERFKVSFGTQRLLKRFSTLRTLSSLRRNFLPQRTQRRDVHELNEFYELDELF